MYRLNILYVKLLIMMTESKIKETRYSITSSIQRNRIRCRYNYGIYTIEKTKQVLHTLLYRWESTNINRLLCYYYDLRIRSEFGFVVTLRYRLAAVCPSMVWLLQLPPLHTQREGKLMKVLTRIMPSNVGSERQAVFATVCS